MKKVYLVTGSKKKFEEITNILSFQIKKHELDLDEIQSMDVYAIAKDKAKQAYKKLKHPVVVEDVAFYIKGLNNFPGPLVKWLLVSIKDKGVYKVTKHLKDKSALTRCVVCYFDGKTYRFFTGDVKGKIIDPKNRKAFGFDSIFKPNGLKKSYSQLKTKDLISHRAIAWKKFEDFLLHKSL